METQSVFRRIKATEKETLRSEKKAPGKLAAAKGAQKLVKSTNGKASKGFAIAIVKNAASCGGWPHQALYQTSAT